MLATATVFTVFQLGKQQFRMKLILKEPKKLLMKFTILERPSSELPVDSHFSERTF